jgi:CubicO group peptidase (beta-lactamase class C family)
VDIQGQVETAFEPVRDTFAELWDDIEVGASCCIYVRGEKVVDIWGGYLDRDMTQPWQRDTLINVYSTTKGPASLAIAILFDEGLISYDEKVSTYWPEFGAQGKQDVTIAQLLSHQAGLCGVETKLTVADLYDWEKMVNLLAAQRPLWEPGSAAGYHAVTWGYFPGELVRRITGKTLGQYFHERVAAPLGADFYIGLPESELARCGVLIGPNHARKKPQAAPAAATTAPEFYEIALLNPSIAPFRDASSDIWRKAEIAAANGQANARGIGTVYGALANGGELNGQAVVSREALAQATKQEVGDQVDLVTGRAMRRGRGFMLNTDHAYGPEDSAYGHGGAGGSTGFADPVSGVGFGYAMNQMQADITATPRSMKLIETFYRCLQA